MVAKVIEAKELYRFYHTGEAEILALRGVSLAVEVGELVALVGPSGSGKSTLLACLAGLDEPDGGHVELMGQKLSRRSEAVRASRRAAHIGILLQGGNLFDQLSVADNITLVMQLAGRVKRGKLEALLELVGLKHRKHARPGQLSGGEAARAGLAVALANDPPILLADEPTGQVDRETEAYLLQLFEARKAQGQASLLVTHSAAVAQMADRVLHLQDGKLVELAAQTIAG